MKRQRKQYAFLLYDTGTVVTNEKVTQTIRLPPVRYGGSAEFCARSKKRPLPGGRTELSCFLCCRYLSPPASLPTGVEWLEPAAAAVLPVFVSPCITAHRSGMAGTCCCCCCVAGVCLPLHHCPQEWNGWNLLLLLLCCRCLSPPASLPTGVQWLEPAAAVLLNVLGCRLTY